MARERLILVAEDEPLIALNLTEILADAGFRVLGPVRSCSDGLTMLARSSPHAAILDVTLTDGSCAPLAHELNRRTIPFLVATGLTEQEIDGIGQQAGVLAKPYESERLLGMLAEILERDGAP